MTGPAEQPATTRWYADTRSEPSATHESVLDEDLDVLNDAGARRLNKRALWVLGGSVVVMLALMLWVGQSFGSARTAPSSENIRPESVESPELPNSPAFEASSNATIEGGGGSGGEGMSNPTSHETGLPPLPPEPIQLAHDENVERSAGETAAYSAQTSPAYVSPSTERASLVQRRIWNGNSADASAGGGDPFQSEAQTQTRTASAAGKSKVSRLQHPSTLLLRGTYLRCALASKIVSDVEGFTSCVIVEPVYAVDGGSVLLERGTRLMGQYASGGGVGDRLAVRWDRAITPSGLDVELGGAGTDTLGGAGHPGKGSSHWGERIASALLISILSDGFKFAAAKNGLRDTVIYAGGTVVTEPFNSNTAQTAQGLAEQALSQGAGRPRTLIIRQGTLLNVYVTEDIDFHDVLGQSDQR